MCAMNGNEDRDIQSYAMSDSYWVNRNRFAYLGEILDGGVCVFILEAFWFGCSAGQ